MTPRDPAGHRKAAPRDAGDAGAIGADLWSAPASAQPADDLPARPLPGPPRQPPGRAPRGTRRPRPAGRRAPRKTISLAIAAAVLAGLGLAAQRLDPSRGAAPGPGAISTQNPSPSPAGAPGGGTAAVVTGGPPYCPMQAAPSGLDCFYIG